MRWTSNSRDPTQMQSGPLTFRANGVTFPCLVLAWVWHIPSMPSFSATGRTIILVPLLSQRSSFLKLLVDQLKFASVGESGGTLGALQTTWVSSQLRPSSKPSKVSVLPTAVEITCDSSQLLQLLCPRLGRQASPLNILGSQERQKQEVTCGLESEPGVLH